ncbi:MAG: flagellar assembly protein FliW [Candidatus Hinthialibacter antarcticus]|nr:flagellar assembly protein FliW [Candidatus Hinthialibacter antarcticus]
MNTSNTSDAMIEFETTRFGSITIPETDVLDLPEGLVGFNLYHRFTILKDPEQEPFLWLQSLNEPDLAFVVVNPFLFFPGYEIKVKNSDLASIGLDDLAKAEVLTIVTIPTNPMDLTTNLRGPMVVNVEDKVAKQFVLIDDRYNTKHFLLHDIPPELAAPVADSSTPKQGKVVELDAGKRRDEGKGT